MIRLFVAIDIPETIRREVEGMGRSIPNARPVPADQLHLTLKFIGEVESSRLLDIQDALEEIFLPKFSLVIKRRRHLPAPWYSTYPLGWGRA